MFQLKHDLNARVMCTKIDVSCIDKCLTFSQIRKMSKMAPRNLSVKLNDLRDTLKFVYVDIEYTQSIIYVLIVILQKFIAHMYFSTQQIKDHKIQCINIKSNQMAILS